MWRRYGDAVYAGLVLFVFSIEALGLTVLTWAFVVNDSWGADGSGLWTVLFSAIALTGLALMVVTGYTLGYEALVERRESRRDHELVTWGERWVGVLFDTQPLPEDPIPEAGVDALLSLREVMRGPEGDRVLELIDEYRVLPELISAARDRRPGWRRRIPVGAGRLTIRLRALDCLGRARHPEAVEPLLVLTADRDPAISILALRALARSAAAIADDDHRRWAASSLTYLMETTDVPKGVLEETLLLLEDLAPLLIEQMLTTPAESAVHLLPLVLDAAGRLQLASLAGLVADQAGHTSPEVRAASLRSMGLLGNVPESAERAVLTSLHDPEEIVRIQAARVAYVLAPEAALPELWRLLGDQSWWVRRAAGWAHTRMGADAFDQLERASREHEDRFARHMAGQVLFDTGRLDAVHTLALRTAG